MTLLYSIRPPSLLATALTLGATALLTAAYLMKRKLNCICPRVPLTSLPPSSAIHNLISTATSEHLPHPAWGLKTSPLLSSGGSVATSSSKTHQIHSFLALQVQLPISHLLPTKPPSTSTSQPDVDAYPLTETLLSNFLSARSTGPEARFLLDKDVPPLSFSSPGHLLFGQPPPSGLGAFLLGTWSTNRKLSLLEPDTALLPQPVTVFPSNQNVVLEDKDGADTAGAVMYWLAPRSMVRAVDMMAVGAYGFMPWRMMEGGYQEWIVERLPSKQDGDDMEEGEEMVKVTYVTVEMSNLHPLGQTERDFKRLPWLFYEAHVLYGQWLFWKTLRRLRKERNGSRFETPGTDP